MAIGGMTSRTGMVGGYDPYNPPRQTNRYTPENAYPAAIRRQAGDYDDIMNRYRSMYDQSSADPEGNDIAAKLKALYGEAGNFTPARYQESDEWRESYGKLRNLADTGGLSQADQANLRARGISPIRAVYANAQRNMDRQARLSGGSANYNASASRMAREMSESMAGATTNVNAKIAEMVQAGKLSATPHLANMATGKNNTLNEIELANMRGRESSLGNRASILAQLRGVYGDRDNSRADALRGMTSLYGTTPALANLYGNQTNQNRQLNMQQNQFNEQRRQNDNQNRLGLLNRYRMG